MDCTMNRLELWEREDRHLHSIPSSTRTVPSKALLLFEPLMDLKRDLVVLDAGCGNGRNAVHLAAKGCKIIATDFSPAALAATSQLAVASGLLDRIEPARVNLSEPLPFVDGS